MKNTDKAGIKGLGFIDIPEHAKNSTANSRKEAVQKRPFFQEIESEFLRNDKDTMAVGTAVSYTHLDVYKRQSLYATTA